MSQENRSIVTYVAAGGIVAIIVTALVGMLVMAVRLDGEIATNVYNSFQWIVVSLIPTLAAVLGIDTVKQVQLAKVAAATPASSTGASEPASDLGGLVDVSGVTGAGVDA